MRRTAESREGGFTFIEILFTMVFFGILVGLSAGPYVNYRRKQEHIATTRELVAALRRAQVRAVAEERTYRVDFSGNGKRVTTFRSTGTAYQSVGTMDATGNTTYSNPSFVQQGGGLGTSVWFYPRGSASKGSVTVTRSGASKTYTVDVEGLTARVSYK